jgi:transketolase
MALRAIPGLVVMRPADATETAEAWRVTLEEIDGPVAFALSRQNLPTLDRSGELGDAAGVARGAYVLAPGDDAVLIGTGAEVHTALGARELLAGDGIGVRVVSMPSWELFEAQDEAYRAEVIPPGMPTASVEAGISLGWDRYSTVHVAIDRFGASAPGTEVLERLGITPQATADAVRGLLGR